MGSGDRKPRRGVRHAQRFRSPVYQEGGHWQSPPAFAKVDSELKAKIQSGNAAVDTIGSDALNWLAQLPSPLRQRPPQLGDDIASPMAISDASPATRSYREQLRANGQRALQLSQESFLMQQSGLPPPPSSPPALGDLIDNGAAPPPPPPPPPFPTLNAHLGGDDRPPTPPLRHADGQTVATTACLEQSPMAHRSVPVLMVPVVSPTCAGQAPHVVTVGPFCTPASSLPTGPLDGTPSPMRQIDLEQIAAQLRAAEPMCYED